MNQMHILVVDDEPFNRDIIAEALDDPAYRLSMAASGEEAWELLSRSEHSFDLVVLDRMMHGIDGIEVLRRIKGDARVAHLPVIMQTAAASPEQVREGLQAGAHYYLTKPFELEALQTIVRAALDDAEQRRRLIEELTDHARVLCLMESARFTLRTLDEAQRMAAMLAHLFPDPQVGAMGLSELLVNAVEHGNLGIDFAEKSRLKEQDAWLEEVHRRQELPEHRDKRVHISISRQAGEWDVLIEDEGRGFAWQDYLDFDPGRAFAPNGRGIALARQLAFPTMRYEGRGNRVRLHVPRAPDAC